MFGESDGLPGLVLDRYGDVVVGQIATAGMEALQERTSRQAVRAMLRPAALFWKNDSGARELEQLPHAAEAAFGDVPEELDGASSAGLEFRGAAARRARRPAGSTTRPPTAQRLLRYLPAGARVLDVCSYVGAWAVTALKHWRASARGAWIPRSWRWHSPARNAKRNGVALEAHCARCLRCAEGAARAAASASTW